MNLFLFISFLCYGSFLNMLAYRLISEESLLIPHSFCPWCKQKLAWFDLIPVVSWVILKARCRSCRSKISYLYPFIEILTASCFMMLVKMIPLPYILSYGIFLSALIITIRTDLETMLISRFATLFLIPVAFVMSFFYYIPLSLHQSMLGAFFGYILLWAINNIFYMLKKQQGIGEGDFDLLAMIGSFIGIQGVWVTLIIASISASLIGLILIFANKLSRNTKFPFGPFIATGAVTYLFSLYSHTTSLVHKVLAYLVP